VLARSMEIFGAEFCGTVAVIGLQRDKKKTLSK
jgi:hypothetical protein